MKDYAITVKELEKSFGTVKVLDGVNLEVERGTMLALLGPNGAGKTTIIRILSTLLKSDGGTAQINGFDINHQAHEVRESIGLTGQYAAVDEILTGFENLKMMGRLYHLSHADSVRRAHELLEQFDLVEAAHRPAKTYSGGMRRRLDLAASLIATPPILYLDEPTTGLDPRSRIAMWNIIQKLVDAEVTILLTTQYLEEADKLADKIAVIDGGKIIAMGTSAELKSRVGKDRLELTIKNDVGFQKAIKVLGETVQSNDKERIINISIEGVKEVQIVLNQMVEAGVEIEYLSLHKPTLDDVFLQLTGHKAAKDQLEEK